MLSNIQSELFTHDTLLALHSNELADNVVTITNLSSSLADNSSRISSLESSSAGGLFTNTITSQRANGQAAALYARDTNNPDRADNVEYNYVLNAPRPGDTQGGIDLFINSANRTDDGGASTATLRNGNGKLRLGYTLYDTLLQSNVAMNTGKIVKYGANGTYLGSPTNSTHGGNGTRFVLWPGTANTAVPYGMGMESAHMWFSSPGGHKFYTGTTEKMSINGNGLDVQGNTYVHNNSIFMSGYNEGPTNNTEYSQYVGKRYYGRILAGMEIENVRTDSSGTAITHTGE